MNATTFMISQTQPAAQVAASPQAQKNPVINVNLAPGTKAEITSGGSANPINITVSNKQVDGLAQPVIQSQRPNPNNPPTAGANIMLVSGSRAAVPVAIVDPVQEAIAGKKEELRAFMKSLPTTSKSLKDNVKTGMQNWNEIFAGYGLNAKDFDSKAETGENGEKDFFSKQEKFLVPDKKDFQEMKVRMLSGKVGKPAEFEKAFGEVNKNIPSKDPFRRVENTQNSIKETVSKIDELLTAEFDGVSFLNPDEKEKVEEIKTKLKAELKKFDEILPEDNEEKPLNKLESETGTALIIRKMNENPNYINEKLIKPTMQALEKELDPIKRGEIITKFEKELNNLLAQTKAYTEGLTQKDIDQIKNDENNKDLKEINSAFLFNKLKQIHNIALLSIGSGMGSQILESGLFPKDAKNQNLGKIIIPFQINKRPADQLTGNTTSYKGLTEHFENVFNQKANLGQGINETLNKLMESPEKSNWPKVKPNTQIKTNSSDFSLPGRPENNLADIYNSTANIFNSHTKPNEQDNKPSGAIKLGFSPFIGISPSSKNENENTQNIEKAANRQLELENVLMQNNIGKDKLNPEAVQERLNNSRLAFLYNAYLQTKLQNPPKA